MAEFGNFDMGDAEMYLLLDDDIFASLDLSFMAPLSVEETNEMEKELKVSDMEGLPCPGVPVHTPPPAKRFKSISENEMQNFQDARQSVSTKRNTKWGIKLFQDWHLEAFGEHLDFLTVTAELLANRLRKFYCEAKPKESKKRSVELTEIQAETYHKNSLKSLRSAVNRHLQDLSRSIDVVRDKEFKAANHTLDGMLKCMTKTGASRATNHKEVIHTEDLQRISSYFKCAPSSPIVLRQCVWYNLSIHFISRGLEFHHQLRRDSFMFQKDENGLQYATLRHETQQKNFQGGIGCHEAPSDKRIYEIPGNDLCPIKMLQLLMSKTDKNATHLFNSCFKDALSLPGLQEVWYTDKPLAKRSFTGFMADICKSSKCMRTYTPHCLRATAITAMSDAGFQARQIMFMSGHRSEASLKTYNRNLSNQQKRLVSSCLSTITNPSDNCPLPTCTSTSTSSAMSVLSGDSSASCVLSMNELPTPVDCSPVLQVPPPQSSVNSVMSTEYLSKSVFNNCVFNFQK